VIRVSIEARDRAIVTVPPTWFDRLLGRTPDPRVAIAVPTLPYGHVGWIWDGSGRPVGYAVHDAIVQARVSETWSGIFAK
jgi:hypothetical protein